MDINIKTVFITRYVRSQNPPEGILANVESGSLAAMVRGAERMALLSVESFFEGKSRVVRCYDTVSGRCRRLSFQLRHMGDFRGRKYFIFCIKYIGFLF